MGLKKYLGLGFVATSLLSSCSMQKSIIFDDVLLEQAILKELPRGYVQAIADSTHVSKNLNYEQKRQYSLDIAQKDAMYELEVGNLQDYLWGKLSQRPHQKRITRDGDKDYSEHYNQIQDIDDKIILSMLKQYVDLFDSFKLSDFQKYFPEQYSPEAGGIVIYDKQLKLVELPNTESEDDSYSNYNNKAAKTLLSVGVFHTHSFKVRYELLPETPMAGPSGTALPQDFELNYHSRWVPSGDFGNLRNRLDVNNKYVDIVITQMKTKPLSKKRIQQEFNVDAYFHNPKEYSKQLRNIDLGVFSFEKKKKKQD